MAESNLSATPDSQTAAASGAALLDRAALDKVASGQRLMIIGLLALILFGLIRHKLGPVTGDFGTAEWIILFLVANAALVACIGGIKGLLRLTAVLQYSVMARTLLVVAILLPLANAVVIVLLSSQATRALHIAGYQAGLPDANRPKQVTAAVALMALGLVLGIPSLWQGISGPNAVVVLLIAVPFLSFLAWLAVSIYQAKNWARITYLIVVMVFAAIELFTAKQLLSIRSVVDVLSFAGTCLEFVVIYLLFTAPASMWFLQHRKRSTQGDPT